ncbi:uncharacterized protein LOC124125760 [Haliotis rufescens]|uniref:uncharacterized protein LOC124125760 n=1 Tax=Haliotis rufescens TaxID=6454 RepID=UPI00201F12A3|nr:uncharacterized protein LOC124125760 [Haliotis rufescens]
MSVKGDECTQNTTQTPRGGDTQLQEANGKTLLFFMYRSEFDRRVRNAIIRFSGRIKSYEGKVLGISTKVNVSAPEGNPWLRRSDWCVTAIAFPSQHKARFWFVSEPEVRQHDFPPISDGFQVFSVPIRYIPKTGQNTFCWTEVAGIRNKGSYQADYVDKVTNLFDSRDVDHGLVYVKDGKECQLDRLKDCWIQQNATYRLDLYSSEQEYWEIFNSDAHQPMKEASESLSETTTVLFTIVPKIS